MKPQGNLRVYKLIAPAGVRAFMDDKVSSQQPAVKRPGHLPSTRADVQHAQRLSRLEVTGRREENSRIIGSKK